MIIMTFRRARLRSVSRDSATSQSPTQQVQKDGSVSVAISDAPVAERVTKAYERVNGDNASSKDQIAEREKMLIKRIAHNPRDAEAYDLLGQVYLVQNNLQDAAECFEQVVALEPQNLRAVEQLKKIIKIQQSGA